MQNDVISQILEIEDSADRILSDADKERSRIIQNAQAESARIVKDATEKAKAEGLRLTEEAEKVYQAHMAEYEETQNRMKESSFSIDEAVLNDVADRIIASICRTEIFGE